MYTSVIVILSSITYATLRYNVFKGVSWSDWPLYVVNKAVALSAILLLAITVIRSRPASTSEQPPELRVAGTLALLHILISVSLLTPAYFPKLFEGERISVTTGFSILAGIGVTTAMLTGKGVPSIRGRLLPVLAFVIGCHAALLGFTGWFVPYEWPGGMPPITLFSFIAGTMACVSGFLPKNER